MSRKQQFSDEELWNIAIAHKKEFTSVGAWNRFAKEKGLPHSQTFIQRFGSWNTLKDKLNLDTNSQHRPLKYDKHELILILKQNKQAFTSIHAWNKYASSHKLPNYEVFLRHLGEGLIMEITGYSSNLTKEDLKGLILTYFPNKPPTVAEWRALSHKKNIPSFSTIIRRFDSWGNMKRIVYMDRLFERNE